jgi:hypothetical protein
MARFSWEICLTQTGVLILSTDFVWNISHSMKNSASYWYKWKKFVITSTGVINDKILIKLEIYRWKKKKKGPSNMKFHENMSSVSRVILCYYENNQQGAPYRLITPSQLYMFRAAFSPIIRSTWLYLQYLVVFTHVAASWCLGWFGTAFQISQADLE